MNSYTTLLLRLQKWLDGYSAALDKRDTVALQKKFEKYCIALIVFLDRSRLSLAAGLAFVTIVGTIKLISPPLHQVLYAWEDTALFFVIPLAYLALRKYNIS